jgi:Sulfocyanin (SoxE) domain
MTLKTSPGPRSLVVALAAMLALGSAAGCSHRSPEPSPSAGPAPKDSVRIDSLILDRARHDTTSTDTAGADTAHARPTDSSAAPTGSNGGTAPSASPAAADSQYLKFDPATNTVTFLLSAGPFNFNGFTSGGATLTIPPRSNNVMNFEQNDGTPHSAVIVAGTGPLPNADGDPAIPRGYTNKVTEGLPQGAKDVIRLTAPDRGTYRIICGVPGHALSGMWIWLKVDPSAKTPSFGPSK